MANADDVEWLVARLRPTPIRHFTEPVQLRHTDHSGRPGHVYIRCLRNDRAPHFDQCDLFDGLGSVAAVTNTSGAVVNRYGYDPYGTTTETRLTGAVTNPWRYTGQYQDVSTGLHKIGARYYQADLGRWTQLDPSRSELNHYLYVGANPINLTDPSGCNPLTECAEDCAAALGNILAATPYAQACAGCASVPVPKANPLCWVCGGCIIVWLGLCAIQCVEEFLEG